ncbi:MAG: ATP-binding protein, partial [Desulfovibrionaceae bacterium]|nr:ATP-binding protein [Desulfovibrionaceae bacterium]
QGRIFVHSDPAMLGRQLYSPEEMARLKAGQTSQSRFVPSAGEGQTGFLETWKLFTPSRYHRPARRPPHAAHRHPGQEPPPPAFPEDTHIFVALDSARFEQRLRDYLWQNGGMAALITLAALGGVLLFHYIQNYRSSRRMLEDTQALAAQVIRSYPAALLVADTRGRISLSNALGRELLGLPDASGPSAPPPCLADFPLLDWRALMAELDAGTAVPEREVSLARPRARALPVRLSAARLTGGDGTHQGYLFVLRDLAEIRRLQKQLRQSERMSAFGNLAAGVAHEIRNPLSSIRGYATWLTEKLRHDKMAYATGQILIQETERLNRVMSDLLGMARPHALQLAPVRLDALLERAVQLIRPEAEAKRVALTLQVPAAGQPPTALLDEDRMLQALLNLLVNAVQATDAGGRVEAALEEAPPAADPEGCWQLSISDTGRGMSQVTASQIFTPYFTTKASGTGLGLAIVQQIVAQHDGEIHVYSREGEGTTFTVLLPRRDAGPEHAPIARDSA